MNERPRRPTAVSVIGYAAIGIGLLGLASGLVTAVDSDQIFEYQVVIGLIEVGVALLVIAAGRALLHLRAWGAVVVQVLAILGVVFFIAFGTLFAGLAFRTGGPQVTKMMAAGIGVALFYAVPLTLAARSLASVRRRGLFG